MRALTRFGTWFGATVAVTALGMLTPACGGNGGTGHTGTTSGSGSSGEMTSSSSSGGTGGGGTGGTGGMTSSSSSGGGTGGMTSSSSSSGTGAGGSTGGAHGPEATQLVNSGGVCTSPAYKMVFTLGQPTQNQSKTTSPGYRVQGGLIGANGTLP